MSFACETCGSLTFTLGGSQRLVSSDDVVVDHVQCDGCGAVYDSNRGPNRFKLPGGDSE